MLTEPQKPIILLVEDSDDDAFFFTRTLEKSGVTCSLQHLIDGGQAIEFLQAASREQELPQTIFLDLKMPVVNGFEVLEWMQTQTFAAPIQVIVLSGSEHQHDKDRAASLGAADYIVKPVKVDDFHRFLQDICPAQIGAPS